MAGLEDVLNVGKSIVGPICGSRARALSERDISPMVHAYLLGGYARVQREIPVSMGSAERYIDFGFGDKPFGGNRCVFELAARGTETGAGALSISQNTWEIRKLSRFPSAQANGGRILLLVDLHSSPIEKNQLETGYEKFQLGRGKFERNSVSVLYVHRDLHYRFIWRA